ncbi:MAG: hypothetical protein GXO47_02900 [Chlorobi bacterium]|nr:hypothetical protein [Chlorobiota bacterium]
MRTFPVLLILFSLLLLTSCNKTERLDSNGWSIQTNNKNGILTITNNDLGIVLKNVKLNIEELGILKQVTEWNVEKGVSDLTIKSSNPQSVWKITVTEEGINIAPDVTEAVITGIAPAGEKRIPARTAEQDNDVMYTQMGFVSAANIHNLFDMKTDIMIRFASNSSLKRNENEPVLMNVTIKPDDGNEITLIRNYYDDVVGLSKYELKGYKPAYSPIADRFRTAPTGWSSWYCYYMSPTEESLFAETDAIAMKLKSYGVKYIQLDAAYTRGPEANWLEWNKELYPEGGKAWFDHVISKGFTPGLWMNIYGANYENPAMANGKYPENFYLKDKNGNLSPVCCSADKTVKRLDYTNPDVIEKHLKPLMDTLVNKWGLGYIKAGGWGTWMDFFEKNRENAFNPEMNSREVYRKTLDVLRNKLGNDGYLLGCAMHEVGVGFNYFDGSRTGGDDYASWFGKNHWSGGMQTFFNSLFGANYLNGITWWSDPDDVMVRDPLTMEEGKTIVTTIALSGQAYIFSDFVADFTKERLEKFLNSKYHIGWAKQFPDLVKPLPDEKLQLYKKTMPAMPIKAIDLYPYKTKPKCCPKPASFPKALDLKVNSVTGQYDVVSLYNWGETDTLKSLNLYSDLGLYKDSGYIAFDFWNEKMVIINDSIIEETVPSHGTLTLIIRKKTYYPVIIATSRHISGALSIKQYKWDMASQTISGKSEVIPESEYSVFIYTPAMLSPKELKVTSSSGTSVCENPDINLLKVTFKPKENSLTWSIHFPG